MLEKQRGQKRNKGPRDGQRRDDMRDMRASRIQTAGRKVRIAELREREMMGE